MKVNRSTFDKIKLKWDMLRLTSSVTKYYADEDDRRDEEDDFFIDEKGYFKDKPVPQNPEEFHKRYKPVHSPLISTRRQIMRQMKVLEELSNTLLQEEKYLEMQECKELWEKLNNKLNNL